MYAKKLVAFIDIMGFKELLFRPATFGEINEILKEFEKGINFHDDNFAMSIEMLKAKIEKPKDEKLRFDGNKANLTFASDCVIWSYPLDDLKIDYWHLVHDALSFLKIIQISLYHKGIVIRGGVTIGNLYQQGNKVFGDGLVNAYMLEKRADFPRIAIDRKLLRPINTKIIDNLFIKTMLSFDRHAGFFYVDILKYYALTYELIEYDSDKQGKALMEGIANRYSSEIIPVINSGLNQRSYKIKVKYFWLYLQAKKFSKLFKVMKEQGLKDIDFYERIILYVYYYYRVVRSRFQKNT
jgi:hypothetical protein